MTNTWNTDLAAAYGRHCGTLRGALRHALVDRALAEHLPAEPQHILDIGGGAGIQAQRLAQRGHHVTLLDPDETALAQARAAWLPYAERAHGTLSFLHGTGEQAPQLAGTGWDAVLCHGVLMYVDDLAPLLRGLAHCVTSGGLTSVLARQQEALAMRPGLERDWPRAQEALRTETEAGPSRGVDREEVMRLLAAHHIHPIRWYGVRVFTDHLGDEPVSEDFDQVLDAEWEAGRRTPYRHIARHFHLIAHRTEDEDEDEEEDEDQG
ncbi:methyltransferase domain-containing protein [Streptomyces sp. NPDC002446]